MPTRWQGYGKAKDEGQSDENDADASIALPPSPEERQLHAYDTLRDEILVNVDATLSQNTRGIIAIGAVIGYALRFGPTTVVALVPVILGYLLVRNAESQVWMMTHARHLIELERALSSPDDPFRYEYRRGGLYGNDQIGLLKLRDVPSAVRIVAAVVAYVVSVVIVTSVVWPDSPPVINDFRLTKERIWTGYLGLSVILAVVGISTVMYRRALKREVAESDRGDREPLSSEEE